jgi:Cft2 family RNA processing exonuclease
MWRVTLERGSIRLPQIDWWLDAHFPAPRSFVSHAHFDHLAAHRTVLLSETTARLMRARMPGKRTEIALPFGTPWTDGEATFTLVPAGHILGSAQALVESAQGRLLYTGDFKLRQGLSAEPCETPRADVLIMETTYGRPQYRFPPSAQVLREVCSFGV